jgi:cGMP-dependent protein kinase 1
LAPTIEEGDEDEDEDEDGENGEGVITGGDTKGKGAGVAVNNPPPPPPPTATSTAATKSTSGFFSSLGFGFPSASVAQSSTVNTQNTVKKQLSMTVVKGRFGMGLELGYADGVGTYVQHLKILPDGEPNPSAACDPSVEISDVIISINGKTTVGFAMNQVIEYIKEAGGVVELAVERIVVTESASVSAAGDGGGNKESNLELAFKAKQRARANVFMQGANSESMANYQLVKIPKSAEEIQFIKNTLLENYIFKTFNETDLESFVDAMSKRQECCESQTIFTQGQAGDYMYIAAQGSFSVIINEKVVAKIEASEEKGRLFGELALLYNAPRAATIRSESAGVYYTLDAISYKMIGSKSSSTRAAEIKSFLSKIPLLEGLSEAQFEKLCDAVEVVPYSAAASIVKKGDVGNIFYMIKEGSVEVSNFGSEGGSLILKAGDYFGERALLTGEPRSADCVAVTDVITLALDRESFNNMLGPLKEVMDANESKKEQSTRDAKVEEKVNRSSSFLNISMDQLKEVALLGSGTFGRVTLVQDKKEASKVYALKTMLKSEIVAMKQQTNVINERNMMALCDHTFILRLYQTYKDPKRLQMLLEFVQGGELFSLLHTDTSNNFPDEQAKFYAAGVILALGHMHSKDIAYRDMKPENCLIDKFGYPKLIDFGFAKVITGKSFTLCGTPEYLAPELILNRGHNMSVDYWAFGILVYEMQAGYSPFCDHQAGDPQTICKNIINSKCVYPPKFNKDCQALCQGLLTREVQSRLGNLKGGVGDITNHKWFSSIKMDDYMQRKIKAPWIPKVKDDLDFSNFQPYDDQHVDKSNFTDRGDWDADF